MSRDLSPLDPPYAEAIDALLTRYPHRDGELPGLFRVFARSERFLRKGVADLLDRGSPLALRERELLILRTCARLGCEYEWGVHVAAFSRAAVLTPEQVRSTRLGTPTDPCWSEGDRLLLEVADALSGGGRMDAETLARFRGSLTAERQLEVFAVCGNYHTVAFVANHAALPREPWAEPFPTP
jgi:alkylhydroperoxidase family enzyme